MNAMVNIVYFQQNKKSYLKDLLDEYNTYPVTVDIFIHSNKYKISDLKDINYTNGNVKVIKYFLNIKYLLFSNRGYYLTWAPRKFIKNNLNNYDIFIFSDDDILIPKSAFKYWLKYKDRLFSEKYLPGFILLEVNNDNEEVALGFDNKKLTEIIKIENTNFYVHNNYKYTASWIYDKNMMNYWIESGKYNIKTAVNKKDLRSNLLDLLKINNLALRYKFYDFRNKKGYGIRENSAYGMATPNSNLIKNVLLKIEDNELSDEIKIYHLDSHYSKENHPSAQVKLKQII